jgi:predicted RNase H-related nuclease YkuK (DUF458 family)
MSWDEAREAIINSSSESSIYIGADSIRHKKKNGQFWAKYCVVVVIHTDSKRGCRLFHKTYDEPDYGGLKQRLLNEVNYAVSCASELVDVIGDRYFEIHLDLNPDPKHKSNIAVKEALGWVKGQFGIDAVVKPASFAATHAADHVVRH